MISLPLRPPHHCSAYESSSVVDSVVQPTNRAILSTQVYCNAPEFCFLLTTLTPAIGSGHGFAGVV